MNPIQRAGSKKGCEAYGGESGRKKTEQASTEQFSLEEDIQKLGTLSVAATCSGSFVHVHVYPNVRHPDRL